MAGHRVLTGFRQASDCVGVQSDPRLCFNIQASLYVIAHKTTRQLNRESRWDRKCIDQHMHMCMLIKVFTFHR